MKNYVKESVIDLTGEDQERPKTRQPGQPINEVCASENLEKVLQEGVELKVSYKVPESEAAKYVSDKTTGMEIPPPEATLVGTTAGLGLKRKNAEITKELVSLAINVLCLGNCR